MFFVCAVSFLSAWALKKRTTRGVYGHRWELHYVVANLIWLAWRFDVWIKHTVLCGHGPI